MFWTGALAVHLEALHADVHPSDAAVVGRVVLAAGHVVGEADGVVVRRATGQTLELGGVQLSFSLSLDLLAPAIFA